MIRVRPLSADEARRYFGDRVHIVNWARALDRDGDVLAIAGFADDDWISRTWLASSNWMMWAFFMVYRQPTRRETVAMIREMRKALRDYGGPVYSECQQDCFATAERIHHLLGFRSTGRRENGREIFVWQN